MSEERFFKGTPASPGVYRGIAKVILSTEDFHKVVKGDIIVVYSSSPAWTIPLLKAGGLISEVGGIICHTAIISRELGIPCVVGASEITKKLKDGDIIEINGEKGEVHVFRQ